MKDVVERLLPEPPERQTSSYLLPCTNEGGRTPEPTITYVGGDSHDDQTSIQDQISFLGMVWGWRKGPGQPGGDSPTRLRVLP